MNIYIGIDNGVSGSIGIISKDLVTFFPTPTIEQYNYTKKKSKLRRIDVMSLKKILEQFKNLNVRVGIERPMVNPKRFKASTSALRALEATLILIEEMGFAYEYLDSKEWQKSLLPLGIKGTSELKNASCEIGCRKFPKLSESIKKHKDADGLLIAEYLRLKYEF